MIETGERFIVELALDVNNIDQVLIPLKPKVNAAQRALVLTLADLGDLQAAIVANR